MYVSMMYDGAITSSGIFTEVLTMRLCYRRTGEEKGTGNRGKSGKLDAKSQ